MLCASGKRVVGDKVPRSLRLGVARYRGKGGLGEKDRVFDYLWPLKGGNRALESEEYANLPLFAATCLERGLPMV